MPPSRGTPPRRRSALRATVARPSTPLASPSTLPPRAASGRHHSAPLTRAQAGRPGNRLRPTGSGRHSQIRPGGIGSTRRSRGSPTPAVADAAPGHGLHTIAPLQHHDLPALARGHHHGPCIVVRLTIYDNDVRCTSNQLSPLMYLYPLDQNKSFLNSTHHLFSSQATNI